MTANAIPFWSETLSRYLTASAGTLFSTLRQRGFALHHVIDNSFADMQRPYDFFPLWFSACGIYYLCPQKTSDEMQIDPAMAVEHCSHRMQDYFNCREHYIFLDIDSQENSFDQPLAQLKQQGRSP